ncbi:MAG: hypothetical protein CMH59_11140 [Myxococcales bacterium]|nr:hypothetical protein [Myxococcales bacterium]
MVAACVGGDDDAWTELERRHGRAVQLVVLHVLDERRAEATGPDLTELPTVTARVWERVRRNGGGALRVWAGGQLAAYLAVLARREAERHVEDETPAAALVAHLPTPVFLTRDPALGERIAEKLEATLARLGPRASTFVRLRQRGLSLADVAATLGQPQPAVQEDLARVAERLAEVQGGETALAWRVQLDAATPMERVRVAVRTEDDGAFRRGRTVAEAAWRRMRERALRERVGWEPGPLQDAHSVAAFVDGSMRGSERAHAEGHLTTCVRSVDAVATLVLDLHGIRALRGREGLPDVSALAAACLATTRFRLAATLAKAADMTRPEAAPLFRLASAGRALQVGSAPRGEDSRVVSTRIPSDDEAPIVALEALVRGDARAAHRAIDDHAAKQTVGLRLRLLAGASGPDLGEARAIAERVSEMTSPDPGLGVDAMMVRALPEGRALPWESLTERLRDVVRDAMRFALSRL